MKVGRGYVFESRGNLYLSMVSKKTAGVLRCISQNTKKLTAINSSDVQRVLSPGDSAKLLKTFYP